LLAVLVVSDFGDFAALLDCLRTPHRLR